MADQKDDESEGYMGKALDYLRGSAAASTKKQPKPTPKPPIDEDKAKEVEDSFKNAF